MLSATPISYWIGFHAFLVILLGIELLCAGKRQSTKKAALWTTGWIAVAVAFSGFILHTMGRADAVQYLTGYVIEESLSVDNLFVFLLLFGAFKITGAHQRRVLFWGVLGAIVMRGLFVAAGLELLARFDWMRYLFAAILLFAAIKLMIPKKHESTPGWLLWLQKLHPVSLRQDKFFVRENGRRMMTVLFLALIAIELTDIVFALDSIPAVLSITQHPFIAYTSNIMAVMGLRSLYFVLAGMLNRLALLHYGLAAVLAFVAAKMLLAHVYEISPGISLIVIFVLLGSTTAASLLRPEAQ